MIKGSHHSPESLLKQSVAHKKATSSLEVRTKMSYAHGGNMHMQTCARCGKTFHVKQSRLHSGRGKYCSRECQHEGHHVIRTCEACGKQFKCELNVVNAGWGRCCSRKCYYTIHSLDMRGEKHHNWQGGISFEPYCPKFDKGLKRRIRAFFDNRCALCGKTAEDNGWNLSCHHVEYNKKACCDGEPVHFAALCKNCHAKTNNDRDRWESMIHRIIDEIYDGRSYFTKDEWQEMTYMEKIRA